MKKIVPILLFALAPIFAMSQATTLIISEFAEGSGSNKYIEIYNGTAAPVDLGLYSLSSCSNGCNNINEFDFPNTVTFAPGTMLASGATYIIAHGSADPIIQAVTDQTHSFLSNGNDLYALTLAGATASVYTVIDMIGSMGGNIGTGWRIGNTANATQNHTLVRKPTTCLGNPTDTLSFGIDDATSEWWVFPSNYWDSLAMHTDNCVIVGCNTYGSTTQVACGSYTGPSGAIFTTTGIHSDTIPNAAMCDSIIAIDLTINPVYNVSTTDSTCAATYTFGTQTLTMTGMYTELFTTALGCDSTVVLDLTFVASYTTNVADTICDGQTYVLGTQSITTAGPYSELFMAVGGCDSTVNLTLVVLATSMATIDTATCNTYTSPSGKVWTMTNMYMDTIPNAVGCDSLLTINLTINTPTMSSMTQTACDSYTLNTTTYTASGVFTQTLMNSVGCDSIITLTLDITPTPAAPITSGDSTYCEGDFIVDMTAMSNSTIESLIISGAADATLPGGLPKCIEFYALEDIADLSIYGFGSANNGGGTDGEEYTFPSMPLTAGSYFRVATDSTNFMTFYGIFPNDLSPASNVNGDDAIELFKNGSVIDVLGDINTDGNGEVWEYLDGWAYRKNNSTPNLGVQNDAEWDFSGANALDGATDNASSGSPFPIGTYNYTAPTSTFTWYTNAGLTTMFGTGSPITPGATTQVYYVTETLTGASACTGMSSMLTITVNALPTVTFGALPDTCENSSPVFLSQGSPVSGVYSGTGVTAGSFDPATAGVGTQTLTYTYTDANGCSAFATSDITVNPLPTVTFGTLADMCVYNSAITLSQGSPAGGTYSGTGVTAGSFDPAAAGNGTHTITYSYTDGNGCSATATADVLVDACASVKEINVNNVTVYPNPTKGNIAISFEGASASVMVMDVKGQSLVTNTIVSNQSIDLSMLSAGTYFVKVTVDGNSFTQRIIVE